MSWAVETGVASLGCDSLTSVDWRLGALMGMIGSEVALGDTITVK